MGECNAVSTFLLGTSLRDINGCPHGHSVWWVSIALLVSFEAVFPWILTCECFRRVSVSTASVVRAWSRRLLVARWGLGFNLFGGVQRCVYFLAWPPKNGCPHGHSVWWASSALLVSFEAVFSWILTGQCFRRVSVSTASVVRAWSRR